MRSFRAFEGLGVSKSNPAWFFTFTRICLSSEELQRVILRPNYDFTLFGIFTFKVLGVESPVKGPYGVNATI